MPSPRPYILDALTLSPIFTALINGMADTPQMVAAAKASLNNCIMIFSLLLIYDFVFWIFVWLSGGSI